MRDLPPRNLIPIYGFRFVCNIQFLSIRLRNKMHPTVYLNISLLFFICIIFKGSQSVTTNLSCYQCVKNTNVECPLEDLKPCPDISDRCVTHISKNAEQGLLLKRECGLGPCSFDDVAMSRGLGMDLDNCDRSRDEYFCLFCCMESGCNKSQATNLIPNYILILCFLSLYFLIKQQ